LLVRRGLAKGSLRVDRLGIRGHNPKRLRHPALTCRGAPRLREHLSKGPQLVFHVFAALAEFIRELIVEGTREGLDAARARGIRLGRPPAMTAEQVQHARDLLTRPDNTVSSIARLLGVSRATIYKYVPEVASEHNPPTLPTPRTPLEQAQANRDEHGPEPVSR
jgi:hypothetical protein